MSALRKEKDVFYYDYCVMEYASLVENATQVYNLGPAMEVLRPLSLETQAPHRKRMPEERNILARKAVLFILKRNLICTSFQTRSYI